MSLSPPMLRARLTDTQLRRIGFGIIGAIVAILVTSIAIDISNGSTASVLESLVIGTAFGFVLTISIRAQPRNGAVWTMMWAAFFGSVGDTARTIGEAVSELSFSAIELGAVTASPSSIEPLAALGFSFTSVAWLPGAFLLAIHLLILFPNGEAPSVRWRRVAWAATLMLGVMVVAGLIYTAPWVDTPYDEIFENDLSPGLFSVLMMPLMAAALATVVQLIRRYRASSGEERLQYRWVTWALAIYVVNIFSFGLVPDAIASFISTATLANIAVAVGIAITRYGLYSIDIVISRSVTYGALAVFIGGVYIVLVAGIGEMLGRESSFGLSIAATVVVAMAFEPARRWVERRANRLVYGNRATPYEVLARFSRRAAEMSDEELLERIPHLIVDGTGASTAALWVRSDDGFRAASSWPDAATSRILSDGEGFEDPDADYSVPVFHDGELLGGISLVKARGETITPGEEDLLANLAGGMGLALRNTRLTAQLRQQVKDLVRSRDRIVSAADQARRSLEHDLDSGPQQQLVAVKVKLGPTRLLAEKAGAEKSARILADIEAQADDAIQAVRDFAGGVYPPLLEAEGLGVALGQQTRRVALPVSVDADGIGRYPRDVEAAVFFSVLEALQNTAKYAEASLAEVVLTEQDGDLVFEVRDDGKGFDTNMVRAGIGLNGIADRIDTVGGSWRFNSNPGSGTIISGVVPVSDGGSA